MRIHPLVLAILLAGAIPAGAPAQKLSIGLIGGPGLTDSFPAEDSPTSFPGSPNPPVAIRTWSPAKDFVAGATLELRFPAHWSFEVGGLHRQLHLTWATVLSDGSINSVSPSPVVTWEFPALAKYRFQWSKVRPFLECGPSFRTTGNLNGTDPSHFGIAAGAGVEAQTHGLTIAPVLRYTRWGADSSRYGPRTRPGQLELLVAIGHASESGLHPLGERVSLGVAGGAQLTRNSPDSAYSILTPVPLAGGGYELTSEAVRTYATRAFVIGPTAEVGLWGGFSVETGALYHPLRYRSESTYFGSRTGTSAVTWEFPVLAKYRLPVVSLRSPLRPFVEAGPSFRLPQQFGGADLATHGVTVGAGMETRIHHLKIAPAFRFTHWAADHPAGGSQLARNQAGLVLGVSF